MSPGQRTAGKDFGLLLLLWRPRRREHTDLEHFNDHLLRDIGLTRLPNRLYRRD